MRRWCRLRLRWIWIALGVSFHLGIAVFLRIAACADVSTAPVTLDGLRFESCDLRGLTSASVRELAASGDALYLLTAAGVERYRSTGTGCSFERDAAFAAPDVDVASIEATADGRLYYTHRTTQGTSVLAWQGSATGQCSSSTAFRKEIAAASDGSVVLAPATGPGLVAVQTSSCTTSPLAFVNDETPRVFGRAGTDVVWGGPVDTGVARYTLAGVEQYAHTDHAFAGRDGHALEPVGPRIASYALGYVFSVDAATGAAVSPVNADRFFAASATDGTKRGALFDAAPDGTSAFVLGVQAGTGACTAVPYLYKLTPGG